MQAHVPPPPPPLPQQQQQRRAAGRSEQTRTSSSPVAQPLQRLGTTGRQIRLLLWGGGGGTDLGSLGLGGLA